MFTADAISTNLLGSSSSSVDRLAVIRPGAETEATSPIDARFDSVLRNVEGMDTAADRDGPSSREQAYEAARDLVSTALIQPLLKMAREDPFQTEMFHGGRTEEAFGAQLDQRVADHIVRSMPLGIVDAIYRETVGKGAMDTSVVAAGRYEARG